MRMVDCRVLREHQGDVHRRNTRRESAESNFYLRVSQAPSDRPKYLLAVIVVLIIVSARPNYLRSV